MPSTPRQPVPLRAPDSADAAILWSGPVHLVHQVHAHGGPTPEPPAPSSPVVRTGRVDATYLFPPTPAGLAELAALVQSTADLTTPRDDRPDASWASSGWVLALPYRLGRGLEPRAAATRAAGAPTAARASGADRDPLPIVAQRVVGLASEPFDGADRGPPAFAVGPLRSGSGRGKYIDAVRRTLSYLRAGDVYQANIALELGATVAGCQRAFFIALAQLADPAFGCFTAFDLPATAFGAARRVSICSVSPELFLDYDARTGRVRTRPMKGTRASDSDPDLLRADPKDRAELAMIVDLMRNDLGRVARTGSVRVPEPRRLERHGRSVLQATASVGATLRDGLGLGELLGAGFPPGSVTGAPKIRAMQIIDELEPFDRGYWCGSIGFCADDGRCILNVGIRTATITAAVPDGNAAPAARLSYPVGAGIVADSDPASEWRETLLKARVLRAALRRARRG